ncbi:acyl-CoA dehydrogenase family protein [Rhodococcus sp. LB1]|uniref:acyl-CoA dehydrogenase family protein n=1 Tax=Rhodococcus sp. LB1 TaxID=1807499 RepID=UPI00077B2756|nr:acyl-CoA dehydrogenase family protein [Rhodococcus sp. LB1]KXX59093.1 hypothetical protein AZG88_42575 [Rhodococcus sp. LB1]
MTHPATLTAAPSSFVRDDDQRRLLERTKELHALIASHLAGNDERGQLADEVVDALHDAGIFGMWVPRELGGFELPPIESLELVESLAYSDPATAWVVMAIALATGTGGAYLDSEAAAQLFSRERTPTIAGQGTRPGKAVPVDGGYLLSGEWSFASGIKHATHIHTAAIVEGTGEMLIFVLPTEEAILVDNWDVMGLRATGSLDYSIDGVFVPRTHTHRVTETVPVTGGALFSLGISNFALIAHSAWAVGVARRLLDELAAQAQARKGRAGQFSSSDSFHEQYARAEALWRGSRAFLFEQWCLLEQTVERGETTTVRDDTLRRLAMTNATEALHEIAAFVYKSAGTSALRSGIIQTIFRDTHAGTQHASSSPAVVQNLGRELAGLADGSHWVFFQLVQD